MVRQGKFGKPSAKAYGAVMIELAVALGILTTTVIPLGIMLSHEQKLCRAYYYHAIAMEIVDGEMEVLAAGEWRSFQQGEQTYTVRAEASKNLPPGRFVFTLREKRLRLEWSPEKPGQGGKIVREASAR